jgi:hypothetical protein
MNDDLEITSHAAVRMAQRNLNLDEVSLVLAFGRVRHCAGAEFHVLCRKDIPRGHEKRLERLVGSVVVVEDEQVITVYKNRDALRIVKRKSKRSAIPRGRRVAAPAFGCSSGAGTPGGIWL